MRISKQYHTDSRIQEKALIWACKNYKYVFQFRNNNIKNGFENKLFASNNRINVNDLNQLNFKPTKYNCSWISYDIKNEIEDLKSSNKDSFNWPKIGLISATVMIDFQGSHATIHSKQNPKTTFNQILNTKIQHSVETNHLDFKSKTSQEKYISDVKSLQKHIEEGDIYEVCYCLEFRSSTRNNFNPVHVFNKLCKESPKPFSNFIKSDNLFLIGASPERYLKKEQTKLLSQPIKGTIRRGKNPKNDEILKNRLFLDPKERSENLMIVDLVRNDLARVSKPGSVKVDELFGIYTFPHVHQMISTISSEIKETVDFQDILRNTFPMGSMTGAPKIKAMQLIETHEDFARGLYSGTVGYFTENGFDFNVVIRSLQFNDTKKRLGLHVGSAITYDSIPEKEFQECNTKLDSVKKIISN